MQKVFWLVPGKLAGRAGPVVEPWDLKTIREAGFTAIASADEECEPTNIKSAGLKHLRHYMPSAYPTTPELVDRFVDLVEEATRAVIGEIRLGGCVLVHCYAGRDRSGLILCTTLMHLEGISAHEAIERVKKVRPVALTGPGVLNVLAEYEHRLLADQNF